MLILLKRKVKMNRIGGSGAHLILATLVLSFSGYLWAVDYYVDNVNSSANDNNPGTASSPWKTIAKANQTVSPGDTVYIKQGTYTGYIAPARSGTAVSKIVYQNYPGESPLISLAGYGIVLDGKQFVTISGIVISNVTGFASAFGTTNCIVTNCVFTQSRSGNYYSGFDMERGSRSNVIVNCTFSRWGSGSDASGDMLNIGLETGSDATWYNRVEGCTLYSAGHSLINLRSGFNIIRNCWMHNEVWSSGYGMRCIISQNSHPLMDGYNIIESNRIAYAAPWYSGTSDFGIDVRSHRNIIRRNYFFNSTAGGVGFEGGISTDQPVWNHVYHNTFYTNGQASGAYQCAIAFDNWGSAIVKSNVIANNIFWKHRQNYVFTDSQQGASVQSFGTNWISTASPMFTDVTTAYGPTTVGKPDLSILTNSPCVNSGGWLTTVSNVSSTGTSFVVADPYFFFDGYGVVPGDTIQLQGQPATSRATITAINYSTRTLTFTPSLTWTNGQGISTPYNGPAPDIGAYEVGAGQPNTKPAPPTNLHVESGA